MLFLFNDVVLDIVPPVDAIRSDGFPLSAGAFAQIGLGEITTLVKEAVYQDINLAHTEPNKCQHLAVLVAAKTGANGVLVGPPASGASKPEEIGIRLAEISLVVMSNLWQMQQGGNLTMAHAYEIVWNSLGE